MNNLIKWGAIAFGAYWLYENYLVPAAAPAPAKAPAASTGTLAQSPPPPAAPPPAGYAVPVRQRIRVPAPNPGKVHGGKEGGMTGYALELNPGRWSVN